MTEPRTPHIDITQEAGRRFFGNPSTAPVVMLNLLKFRETADYSATPDLSPGDPVSGSEAYRLYMEATGPLLAKSGGKLLFAGACSHYVIGPEAEDWDYMLLVKQAGRQAFMTFATDPAYQAIAGHRTAAILDSRLLPIDPAGEFTA